jgi:hypothetical protein
MKPWFFPEVVNTFQKQQVAKFGPSTIYEDGWTVHNPNDETDFDHRMPGSGRIIDTLSAVATGYRNERAVVGGPIFSEGRGSNFYTAGLNDGDYAKLPGFANGKNPEERRVPLLVDFMLQKIHPLQAPVTVELQEGIVTQAAAGEAAEGVIDGWLKSVARSD